MTTLNALKTPKQGQIQVGAIVMLQQAADG
jgi:hypothetical protein